MPSRHPVTNDPPDAASPPLWLPDRPKQDDPPSRAAIPIAPAIRAQWPHAKLHLKHHIARVRRAATNPCLRPQPEHLEHETPIRKQKPQRAHNGPNPRVPSFLPLPPNGPKPQALHPHALPPRRSDPIIRETPRQVESRQL